MKAPRRTTLGEDRRPVPERIGLYASRATPAFERLITDAAARDLVLGDDADNLIQAIRIVAETAEGISWNNYYRSWLRDSPIIAGYLDSEGGEQDA